MDENEKKQRVKRVKELLKEIHNVPIATVGSDGKPHNSPVFMAFDSKLNGFWVSNTDSLHSRNISENPSVFIVVFDSRVGHGGLYISGEAEPLIRQSDVKEAYSYLKSLKDKQSMGFPLINNFIGKSSQKLYRVRPIKIWINKSDRDESGAIIIDRRYELDIEDVLE